MLNNYKIFIIDYEIFIRIGFFVGVFLVVALWEHFAPRRKLSLRKSLRWINNLSIVVLNSFVLRFLFPAAAVGVAVFAQTQQWGLFYYLNLPYWFTLMITVIMLDGIIYLQHILFHAVPIFWRLHRVHHADLDFDVTTGLRFHPIEIILSMGIKFAAIVTLGVPPLAVIIFEVLLNATSMFNHSNIYIPVWFDRILRCLVVTPDMHRVHHSIETFETNSNFGFNFPWWDRLMGTYRAQPQAGHIDITIGIKQYRDKKQVNWLWGMLLLPFAGRVTDYSMGTKREKEK